MNSYLCSKCGVKTSSSNQSTVVERFIGPKQEKKTVSGRGLGTFSCPVHGKVPVRRTKG